MKIIKSDILGKIKNKGDDTNMGPLEQCKCVTPRERSALINAFSFAEAYIKEDLKKHEHDKESAAYRMMNANLIELEYIKSKVKNTPECH